MAVSFAIKLAGVDITADCMLGYCTFVSRTNGAAGECSIRVRATAVNSYVVGSRIELLINGVRIWDGYLTGVEYSYPFSAFELDASSPRYYTLRGVDTNILFTKRIVYNKTSPAKMDGPLYGPYTADTTAISELVTNWLDLSGDGLDTSSGIVGVATINEDQDARPFGPSQTFGDAMTQISALTGAVWYIDPDRVLRYTDDEAISAPFGLSDAPGAGEVGIRDVEIIYGSEPLTNDYFVWGMGYGSDQPVAARVTDTTSVAAHGIWQEARVVTSVYKQATVNRIASSYVYGSPASHRGRNEPQPMIRCRLFEPGLRAGMVVNFQSTAWGISLAIPIRQMTVTLLANGVVEYELVLSRLVDTPWSSIDPYKLVIPNAKPPKLPKLEVPSLAAPSWGTCDGVDCGLTDTFSRWVSVGWGYSDSGLKWSHFWAGSDGSSSFSVAGGQGIITAGSGAQKAALLGPNTPARLPHTVAITVYMTGTISPGSQSANTENAAISDSNSLLQFYPEWQSDPESPVGRLQLRYRGYTPTGSAYDGIDFTQPVRVRMEVTATDVRARWWYAGDPEPSTWHVAINYASISQPPPSDTSFAIQVDAAPFTSTRDFSWYFAELDHSAFNRCTTAAFDTFNRSTSMVAGTGNWGVSSSGGLWSATVNNNTGLAMYCNGYAGVFAAIGALAFGGRAEIDVAALASVSEWTMRLRFRTSADLPYQATNFDALSLRVGDSSSAVELYLQFDGMGNPSNSIVVLDGNWPGVQFSWQGATWYEVKWYASWSGSGTGTSRVKVWKDGDLEPDTWLDEVNWVGGAPSAPILRLEASSNSAGYSRSDEILIDEIDFDYPGAPCAEATLETVIDNWFRARG